jgi:hypothetical protein
LEKLEQNVVRMPGGSNRLVRQDELLEVSLVVRLRRAHLRVRKARRLGIAV